jgi:hypothetical protein
MDSKILEEFSHWLPLIDLCVSRLPSVSCGVYIFTGNENVQYKKGNSKIVYIGETDLFRRRILGNYIGGVGGETTKRIERELFENKFIDKIKIGFKETENVKYEEKRLKICFTNYMDKNHCGIYVKGVYYMRENIAASHLLMRPFPSGSWTTFP